MTGGSLGLRSASYGSLPQLHSSPPVPAPARKNGKVLVHGSREKDRRLSAGGKIPSRRRKVWMLVLLAVTSIAVVWSYCFAISYSDHIWNLVNNGRISSYYLKPPPSPVREDNVNKTSDFSIRQYSVIKETQSLSQFSRPMPIPLQHPCENFSLPPLPADPKRTGPRPCDVCYVPVELAMSYAPSLPSVSPILKNLYYVSEENLLVNESNGGSIFGGHPSLKQRDESFDIKESMTVYCGFVKGKKPGQGTGFDIDEADLLEMEQCHGVVIASAIFGNYDIMQQPKSISEASRRSACFYMFVDEETEASIKNSSTLDSTRKVGFWRVVVVRNLPYLDARRNGKIPKLLLHRLFPNAHFSIWIDGKLQLVVDPYQILERFLWRNNASLAISRHYRRFDVFEEAEANKAAGKYDNASIDYQMEFYKSEGLNHFTPAKYPITSDVPEGCVIIKEHLPITNLFTCLWFNEVDRFTSRDQLSFSTVRDKISPKTNWTPNMFLDCERRNFVVQAYHRDLLEQRLASRDHNQPPSLIRELPRKSPSVVFHNVAASRSTPPRKQSSRRGRDRKSSSKRQRLRGAASLRDPGAF